MSQLDSDDEVGSSTDFDGSKDEFRRQEDTVFGFDQWKAHTGLPLLKTYDQNENPYPVFLVQTDHATDEMKDFLAETKNAKHLRKHRAVCGSFRCHNYVFVIKDTLDNQICAATTAINNNNEIKSISCLVLHNRLLESMSNEDVVNSSIAALAKLRQNGGDYFFDIAVEQLVFKDYRGPNSAQRPSILGFTVRYVLVEYCQTQKAVNNRYELIAGLQIDNWDAFETHARHCSQHVTNRKSQACMRHILQWIGLKRRHYQKQHNNQDPLYILPDPTVLRHQHRYVEQRGNVQQLCVWGSFLAAYRCSAQQTGHVSESSVPKGKF